MVKRKWNRNKKDYELIPDTLEEHKDLEKHKAMMYVLNAFAILAFLTSGSFIVIVMYLMVKNNQAPSMDVIIDVFNHIYSVVTVILGS